MALRAALAASAGRGARGRLANPSAELPALRSAGGDGALPGRSAALFSHAAGGRAEASRASSAVGGAMLLPPASSSGGGSSNSSGGGWGQTAWRALKYGAAAGAALQAHAVFSMSIPREEREWVAGLMCAEAQSQTLLPASVTSTRTPAPLHRQLTCPPPSRPS
jgi:hypothetical protein